MEAKSFYKNYVEQAYSNDQLDIFLIIKYSNIIFHNHYNDTYKLCTIMATLITSTIYSNKTHTMKCDVITLCSILLSCSLLRQPVNNIAEMWIHHNCNSSILTTCISKWPPAIVVHKVLDFLTVNKVYRYH